MTGREHPRGSVWLLSLTLGIGLGASPLRAQEAATSPQPVIRSTPRQEAGPPWGQLVWNFGVNGARNALVSESGRQILGSYGSVQFGAGFLTQRWYALGSLDFLTGPFEPVTVGELDVDYAGTGITFWTGFSPRKAGLRDGGMGYGIALGTSYSDLVGRSIGQARGGRRGPDVGGPSGGPLAIDSYTLQATNVSVIPALFLSWLKKPRPTGNSQDLLATRLEGHILTFGMAFPVAAEFAKKITLAGGDFTSERGHLTGRRFELTWTALLGP